MRKMSLFLATGTALSLLIAPLSLAAQEETRAETGTDETAIDGPAPAADDADEMQQAMAMLGAMFPAEPLTAEQEGRLPQAQRIIDRMIPEGTMSEMMGSMFEKMLGPIMQASSSPATGTITSATGFAAYDLDLTTEQTEELASLFDPAWAERQKREMAVLPSVMAQMMNAMEPGMRKAMAELYAINFNPQELNEIEAFFMTETGTTYARKSFTMSSDPRVMSATMEAMPTIMGAIGTMEQAITEASADLPAKRSFAELTPAEQAKVADLTGYSVEDIEANLAGAAEASLEAIEATKAAAAEAAAE